MQKVYTYPIRDYGMSWELGVENANNLQKKCKTNELSKSEQFQEFRNMITITK